MGKSYSHRKLERGGGEIQSHIKGWVLAWLGTSAAHLRQTLALIISELLISTAVI